MPWGLFEALGSVWESVRGFTSGIFARAVAEDIGWPAVSEALAPEIPPEILAGLGPDFFLQERQAEMAGQIATLRTDYLIPRAFHIETTRLLPHKFVYEVEITQWDRVGEATTHPYYVGSDRRLTQDEILDIAEGEVQNSPEEGAVAYEVGGISASWAVVE